MLVDSHCHLNYLDQSDACIAAARKAGVEAILCIGVEQERIHEVLSCAERHGDVWASVGQHPQGSVVNPDWVEEHLLHPRVVAVGETGLDYHYTRDEDGRSLQRQCFDRQLELARGYDLPVVVHSRSAERDTLDLLRCHEDVIGVLHCFTESWQLAAAALDLGYYISISGIVTFRNGGNVRDIAKKVPRDRLLVETDSPWLAPVPYRGRTNEPSFVVKTAAYLADLLDWPMERLAAQTTANFYRLFGVKSSSNSR